MSKCLVTGHKGYIGSRLFAKLKEQGHEVLGIDLREDTPKDILDFLREDPDGLFHPTFWNFKPEYIFHLACIPRVAYSVEKPVITMDNNVLSTSIVLNFARKVGCKRVIYSGSSSVVGNGNGPSNPYGLQKLVSEMECKLYSDLYDLDTVTLRYFNVYSEDQPAEGPYATAIANWMKYIREGSKPFITGDGHQRRDMAYVHDVVDANIFAMQHDGLFCGKHYDVGTGENISLNEIKQIVEKYHDVEFEYVQERKGDVLLTKANMEPLSELGWKPKMGLTTGINRCFNFGRSK
jgi:nucleoside-diphosphate-sugar epimerase